MKILFLVRTLTYGGAERQLVALARGLHERGHDVRVTVFYPGGPLEPDLTRAGIPVLSADKGGRWDILGFLWRLARTLRRERPDIVHGYLAASNILSLVLRPVHRGKSVWGIRASADLNGGDWLSRLDGWTARRLSRFADLIISNSHAGKRYLVASGYPERATIVIPNGIDTERFAPDPAGRAAVRAELGIADNQVLIGRVGRLDQYKDYPTFLRAAAEIAARRADARFIIVGTGPTAFAAELQALAEELGLGGRLIWAGARNDMPAVYSALDLNISSSVSEGTPNVVAEAMACGVPCVVTDVGDSADMVGDLGAVVPAQNPGELAAAALRMLDDLAAGRIDHAAIRARVVTHLSLSSLIDRSEQALLSLLPAEARLNPRVGEARP